MTIMYEINAHYRTGRRGTLNSKHTTKPMRWDKIVVKLAKHGIALRADQEQKESTMIYDSPKGRFVVERVYL